MTYRNKKYRAFTLIEMLITISIIAITATFAVINLNFQRDDRQVELAAREFYSALQYARNLAISGKVFKDKTGDGAPDVPNGYGLHIALVSSGSDFFYNYIIYGDLYNSGTLKQYDLGTEDFGAMESIDFNEIKASLYFDNGLAGSILLPQTIFFATPRGDITYYNDGSEVTGAVEIGIQFTSARNTAVKKRVVINRVTGQLYVNEAPNLFGPIH